MQIESRTQLPQRFSRDLLGTLQFHEMTRQISVRKSDNLFLLDKLREGPLKVTMTLCPLYEHGPLNDSRLMVPPGAAIERSRVSEKWRVGLTALRVIRDTALKRGYPVEVILTFADIGVISKDPENENPAVLQAHEKVYQQAARRDLVEGLGIACAFRRYSDLSPNFPQFIPVRDESRRLFSSPDWGIRSGVLLKNNPQAKEELAMLVERLRETGVVFDGPQAQTEGLIIKLMRQFGGSISLTEGLIRQYGFFDAKTTRPDALNIFIERESAAVLLQLTDLFPHRRHPRLDVLC